jgi:hypothetical protein
MVMQPTLKWISGCTSRTQKDVTGWAETRKLKGKKVMGKN